MRGEHTTGSTSKAWYRGSSPHARGARQVVPDLHREGRLIPACAGSTPGSPGSAPGSAAHPRMRGEHGGDADAWAATDGSSPHARGAPLDPVPRDRGPGLIPACAGSTAPADADPDRGWAHPRMRGEHFGWASRPGRGYGSSPHARGAHHPHLIPRELVRLIPACAGSTPCSIPTRWLAGAHPRMRGEHPKTACLPTLARGSSPHARGAQGGEVMDT